MSVEQRKAGRSPGAAADGEERFAALTAELTIEEKVALVSGADFWTTAPVERIGLRPLVLSDGPAGVRGPVWDERRPSLNLPSGTALAASWDPDLAYRYGVVVASEASRKGVHVVLGPTINLQRTPLGGRHFECLSEDPLLSGTLAAQWVRGLQDHGVAATPKHFVANDSETDRFTVDVHVDEQALRELYLLPFEMAVEAGAWALMSAYNAVNGTTMTENDLLRHPLEETWGFDGVVISDWTAVRSLAAAVAAQDLAMPGPAPAWGDELVRAVREGRVDESHVDRKVRRLLRLAARVGALGTRATVDAGREVDGPSFAREAATEGAVLLENRGELPWDAGSIGSAVVVGGHARTPRTQGGGSATVLPEYTVNPLEGIRTALPGADVTFEPGAAVRAGLDELPRHQLTDPRTGSTGVRLVFLDASGAVVHDDLRGASALVWFDGDVPLAAARRITLETDFTPDSDGVVELGFASAMPGRLWVDGEQHLEATPVTAEQDDVAAAFLAPPTASAPRAVRAGVPLRLRLELQHEHGDDALSGAASATLGWAPERLDEDLMITRAATAAGAADVAVVVVGTDSASESEGVDRTTLALPGRQDDLVRAVAAANPRTVVVVNAGAPVAMPWRHDVAAVLLVHFGGQELGSALADLLVGAAEPGGRLTATWPRALADAPVVDVAPVSGVLAYTEGLDVGYRGWLRADAEPAYPFGHGLGYTDWLIDGLRVVRRSPSGLSVRVAVENTGARAGKQVVQVYAERDDTGVRRPVRWLVGWAVVRSQPGARSEVEVRVPWRRFAHWVGGRDGHWAVEAGDFTIRAGTSVVDLPMSATVRLPGR
jgi:beta-glucosidase